MKNTKMKSTLTRFAAILMTVFSLTILVPFGAVSASAAAQPAAATTTITAPVSPVAMAVSEGKAQTASIAKIMPAAKSADETYKTVINFLITWLRRVGVAVALVGAIMFGFAIKNNDAEQKQAGLLTLVAGFVVAAICQAADMFDLFT